MPKEATTDHPVHELISQRWSPYAFAERTVAREELCSLLEAARWSASSYNEQPWSYIVATRDQADAFERILACLVEANQAWAKAAPVLLLGCTNHFFTRNGKPNAAAVHDLGLAAGNICAEATARGLSVHQMIGILPDKARELFAIPSGIDAVTALAIGYAADPSSLPAPLQERDTAARSRKPLAEFVFAERWGESAALTKKD